MPEKRRTDGGFSKKVRSMSRKRGGSFGNGRPTRKGAQLSNQEEGEKWLRLSSTGWVGGEELKTVRRRGQSYRNCRRKKKDIGVNH